MPEYNAPGGSGGDSSPLTTKGDLYTFDTDNARLGVGTNGQVLTADSSASTGLTWTAVSGTGNTLDASYDQGGAGAGRTINAEAGAVTIAASASAGNAALSVVHDKTDQIALNVENTSTNATEAALVVSCADLNAATNAAVKVVAGTGTGKEVFKVTANGIEAINAGSAAIIASSDQNTQNAIMQLTTNSKSSTIQQSPSGVVTITANADLTLAATSAPVVVQGNGLSVGAPPTTINTDSAAIGQTHTTVDERSLAVGQGCTATDDSLAVGENCIAGVNSIAVGDAADSTNYTGGSVIAMNDGASIGSNFSPNTLVLDAGNNAPTGAVAVTQPPGAGDGNIYSQAGSFYSGNADYAEMFEWDDGNTNNADRRGFFVSLVNGNKIEVGNSDVIGVISARPVVVGDASELSWKGKYVTDEFGATLYQMVDGKRLARVNSAFNPTTPYTPRRARKEWSPVGLVGKLYVRSAQALSAGNRCTANASGYAVSGNDYRILRVIRQPTPSLYGIVEILMK